MDYQKNTKENIVFGIKSLVLTKVLMSIVLHYTTRLLYLRAYVLSYNQQQVQQYVPKRYNNTIHEQFLRSKIIKAILSSTTRIGLIICMEDPKEAPSIDYVYIEEDTKIEKTTMVDIVTTTHSVGSNAISIIILDASQANIQQKRDNKYILSINNMPNIQENKRLYQSSITASSLYEKEQKIF